MNEVFAKIAAEIREAGAISFARFMELALYCPVYGYYEKEEDTIGRRGDYYTSPSVGSLFGELLGFEFAEWLSPLLSSRGTDGLKIVEAGAHRGRLALDLLDWLRKWRPALFDAVEYWIVEPSPRRRQWQAATLAGYEGKVRIVPRLAELSSRSEGLRGIIFSNELLDAFPAHRLGWDAAGHTWFEWGVGLEGERLVWRRLNAPSSAGEESQPFRHDQNADKPGFEVPEQLLEYLPDGFIVEICPAAEAWWQEAATVLGAGKLLTLDYGFEAEDFLMPERKQGTLRAYSRHCPTVDLLANPGQQDITCHINFTTLSRAGEAAGLRTEDFLSQAQFLTRISRRVWERPAGFPSWTPERTRQFQTLTHPEHLGRTFRVLIQSRPEKV